MDFECIGTDKNKGENNYETSTCGKLKTIKVEDVELLENH